MVETPREQTLTVSQIAHPEYLDGRAIWRDPSLEDFLHRLHHGDPTLGWEGDPRLAVYRLADGRWQLERLEHDGEYRTVCVSKPGLALDNRLIMALVAHDVRRGYDVRADVDARNDAVRRQEEAAAADKLGAAMDKVVWGLRRDIGYHY